MCREGGDVGSWRVRIGWFVAAVAPPLVAFWQHLAAGHPVVAGAALCAYEGGVGRWRPGGGTGSSTGSTMRWDGGSRGSIGGTASSCPARCATSTSRDWRRSASTHPPASATPDARRGQRLSQVPGRPGRPPQLRARVTPTGRTGQRLRRLSQTRIGLHQPFTPTTRRPDPP